MDIVKLPIELEKEKIDSRFRLVVIAAQRARELAFGAKAKLDTKSKKLPTIALEEALEGKLEFMMGDEARVALEEARKLDYKRFIEEKKKDSGTEDMSELERDLSVFLHEREEMDRSVLEELFADKSEDTEEQS